MIVDNSHFAVSRTKVRIKDDLRHFWDYLVSQY